MNLEAKRLPPTETKRLDTENIHSIRKEKDTNPWIGKIAAKAVAKVFQNPKERDLKEEDSGPKIEFCDDKFEIHKSIKQEAK